LKKVTDFAETYCLRVESKVQNHGL